MLLSAFFAQIFPFCPNFAKIFFLRDAAAFPAPTALPHKIFSAIRYLEHILPTVSSNKRYKMRLPKYKIQLFWFR